MRNAPRRIGVKNGFGENKGSEERVTKGEEKTHLKHSEGTSPGKKREEVEKKKGPDLRRGRERAEAKSSFRGIGLGDSNVQKEEW